MNIRIELYYVFQLQDLRYAGHKHKRSWMEIKWKNVLPAQTVDHMRGYTLIPSASVFQKLITRGKTTCYIFTVVYVQVVNTFHLALLIGNKHQSSFLISVELAREEEDDWSSWLFCSTAAPSPLHHLSPPNLLVLDILWISTIDLLQYRYNLCNNLALAT